MHRWDLVGGLSEGSHDSTGGTVGGQIGYRWQQGPIVFGVEAQGNWADFSGDNVSNVFAIDRNRTKIDAFGLFTGQVGYAWNTALLYFKAGGAVVADRNEIMTGKPLDWAAFVAGNSSVPESFNAHIGRR